MNKKFSVQPLKLEHYIWSNKSTFHTYLYFPNYHISFILFISSGGIVVSNIISTSEVAKGKYHSILRLEVSQLSKSLVSHFGTILSVDMCFIFIGQINVVFMQPVYEAVNLCRVDHKGYGTRQTSIRNTLI